MANQPVLNLDRLTDRPVVIIGGEEYRLYTVDLLAPLSNYRVRKLIKRIDELTLRGEEPRFDLTPDEETELGGLLGQAVRIVLEAPDTIQTALNDNQRVEILAVFQAPSWLLKYAAPPAATPDPATTTESPIGSISAPEPPASTPGKAEPSSS